MKLLALFAPWQDNIDFLLIKACTNLLSILNLYTVTYRGYILWLHMMKIDIFFTIVDDLSRSTWVYLLKNKSDAWKSIESFYNLINTQFRAKVKYLKSDNRIEF
jgi:hypothetical protein